MTDEKIMALTRETAIGQALKDEGREEERRSLLASLISDRFGDHPGIADAARRLAAWPDRHAALRAITNATTFDDLLDPPPTA